MKKKSVIIISVLLVIALIVLGIVFYPKYIENKENNKLLSEIEMVNNFLFGSENNLEEINNYINEDIATGERKTIEEKLDNYLKEIINNGSEAKKIVDDESITKDLLTSDVTDKEKRSKLLSDLKEALEKLNIIKDNLDNIKDENIDLLKKVDISKFKDKIDNSIKTIDKKVKALDYLNTNSNWKVEEEKLVFTKRDSLKEYEKLDYSVINYELVSDKEGPVITASDISITKGSSVSIKDKVKCEDKVDGKVECKIEGSYDTNKVGSYTIKITATDESNNKTSKSIKLTVKEKASSNKPYYIEVIRDKNVVVVYGLDSNNKYTKIVKVFICSVGNPLRRTPLGTFTTSDKASWGWLVGNLYGQYYTRITGSILFHSVPYTKKAKNTLEWDEYNKLGEPASKGCIRLTVKDAKWIYDNCPRGTTVKIYDGNLPSGVVKPTAQKISADSPNKGWDPTDPDKNNPWKKG